MSGWFVGWLVIVCVGANLVLRGVIEVEWVGAWVLGKGTNLDNPSLIHLSCYEVLCPPQRFLDRVKGVNL
jgi:hypothetical protein